MKKLKCLFIAFLAMIMFSCPVILCANASTYDNFMSYAGDVNGDGKVTLLDALKLIKLSVNGIPLEKEISPWEESKHRLEFNENGEFKVLILSDMHVKTTLSDLARTNMELLIERENPDLVMFSGDSTWKISTESALKTAVTSMVELLEEKQIPWGHVYGNHDCEGSNVSKSKQQKIYESFDYCVSMAGDENLPGLGNYVLPVYAHDGDKVVFNVWALDSGEYLTTAEKSAYMPVTSTYQGYTNSKYDYIDPALIAWYTNTSAKMEVYNGAKVPGMMVFHIPLQEYYNAWVNREGLNFTGEKREILCASEINSGMFAAMVARGDIKAVATGHDHRNDFMVEYGGIKLCYCSTISETGYCDEDMLGGRVFVVKENNPSDVKTYMSYVDEEKMIENAEPLSEGVLLDFDSYTPEFDKSGLWNAVDDACRLDNVVVEIADGKGINGTKALHVARLNYGSGTTPNNVEIRMPLENPGKLGESKYFRVWLDLTGETAQVDFRKASFGFIEENAVKYANSTDNLDEPSPFWYLADGTTEWVEMTTGNDGCFGAKQNSSVKGFKGWFAFPIENMLKYKSLTALTEDSYLTHVYFYFSISSDEMKGNPIYLDDISIVKDYTVFE